MTRLGRLAAGLATATVLSVTASGCVTVHGELEVVPGATRAEAAKALADFTVAYNRADKAYDPALDEDRVTGSLGAINQAGLTARRENNPDGNAAHKPLELSDATYTIPKKAGWPRWFLADTDSNRDQDGGKLDTRWLLAFVRTGADAPWKVAYLAVVAPSEMPKFRKDADGWAQPVPAADTDATLATPPAELSTTYTGYLQNGAPDVFAPGVDDLGLAGRAQEHPQGGVLVPVRRPGPGFRDVRAAGSDDGGRRGAGLLQQQALRAADGGRGAAPDGLGGRAGAADRRGEEHPHQGAGLQSAGLRPEEGRGGRRGHGRQGARAEPAAGTGRGRGVLTTATS